MQRRILRSHKELQDEGRELAKQIEVGTIFAVELAYVDKNSDNEPWVLCMATKKLRKYQGESRPWTSQMEESWMGKLGKGMEILYVVKLATLSTGSSVFVESNTKFWVFGEDVQVINMKPKRIEGKNTRSKTAPRDELSRAQKQLILERLAADTLRERE